MLPPVLHADDWLLVVDKPAGMLSVAGRGPAGEDCLHARLRQAWPDALVVHRLDMATSGLMVFARGERAQRILSIAFAARAVDKRYVAIVAGKPEPANTDGEGWATIELPLAADWPARPRQKVDAASGRPSLTRWRIAREALRAREGGTRLELQPVTGRSHQLRVHLAAIGHPDRGRRALRTRADRPARRRDSCCTRSPSRWPTRPTAGPSSGGATRPSDDYQVDSPSPVTRRTP